MFLDLRPGSGSEGPTLVYRRAPGLPEFLRDRFFLQVHPRDPGALPAERAPYGFETQDFDFLRLGVLLPLDSGVRACVASARLPDYGISRIRTGQYRSGEPPLWSVEIHPE